MEIRPTRHRKKVEPIEPISPTLHTKRDQHQPPPKREDEKKKRKPPYDSGHKVDYYA